MKRLRHDLNYLTSAGLLVAAVATGVTGLVADLWDLNDFWYHTLAGYVMGGLAIVHVVLNWGSLVGYARFRLTKRPSRPQPARTNTPAPTPPGAATPARVPAGSAAAARAVTARTAVAPTPQPARSPLGSAAHAVISRRGLLGVAAGSAAGLFFGRGLRQPPPIQGGQDLGVVYHQWSKPGVIDVLGSVANWGQQPPLYKEYPSAPVTRLPRPTLEGGLRTEQAIERRRSARDYSGAPMPIEELSRVLFLTSGIAADEFGNKHRTAPSSGALYPIEVYPVVHNVDGVERGVYHYSYQHHALEQVRAGDFREQLVQQALMQEFLGECNVVVFLTMIMQRMRFKYQDRAYRYGLLEAGHLGQNLYLAATSIGLGACAVGAYMDDDINRMLGIDGVEEASVYMLALGRV